MTSPLPPGTVWPPPQVADYVHEWAQWAAWWAGDPEELTDAASGVIPGYAELDRNQGWWGRFWSRQRRDTPSTTPARNPIHVPLAADIAQTSADLLFGEEPGIEVDGPAKTQTALDDLITDTTAINVLHYGAEQAAALGGVYLRPVWDEAVADHPLLTVIGQDRAIPDLRLGVLIAVTFWEDLPQIDRDQRDVRWRHLERHERDRIVHTLHKGTPGLLGPEFPLDAHPLTQGMPGTVDTSGIVPAGLLVSYVPNAPSRRWRNRGVGRADVAGLGSLLDALDETWSSWMRDIRLGQARILVADGLLDTVRTRSGDVRRSFDVDNEVFSPLPGLDPQTNGAQAITEVQFNLRVAEHKETTEALIEKIVTSAGYAPQTFGLHTEGAISGTAHQLRELKTHRTTGQKQRAWKPAAERTLFVLQAIAHARFRGPEPATVSLTWPENDVDEPKSRAETIDLLKRAEAISLETAVRMAQPQLDEDEVAEEVARIKAGRTGAVDLGDPSPGEEPTFGAPDQQQPTDEQDQPGEVEGE